MKKIIFVCLILIFAIPVFAQQQWEAEVTSKSTKDQNGNFRLGVQIRETVSGNSWDREYYIDTDTYKTTQQIVDFIENEIERYQERNSLYNQVNIGASVNLGTWRATVTSKSAQGQNGNFTLGIRIEETVSQQVFNIELFINDSFETLQDIVQLLQSKINRYQEKNTLWNQINVGVVVQLNP